MQDFKNLKVWRKSHKFTLSIYSITDNFPNTEKYGLISQLRRASSSIPTNIAEGSGRGSDAEFKRFLQIAFGSASEVEYLLILSKDLMFLDDQLHQELDSNIQEIKKMLATFVNRLKTPKQ